MRIGRSTLVGTAVAMALFGANFPAGAQQQPTANGANGQSSTAHRQRKPGAAPADSSGQRGATSASSDESSALNPVVVTGSAYPERRFNVSYAVNSLSARKIKELAPSS